MDLLGHRTSSLKRNSLRLAAAAPMLAVVSMACGTPAASDDDDYGCQVQQVFEDFRKQSNGVITAEDLTARSNDSDEREAELIGLGLQEGYFSFWKETADEVPFDPLENVVCQALIFVDEQGAKGFVGGLEPTSASLHAATMTWPDRDVSVTEIETGNPQSRAFIAENADSGLLLYTIFEARGRRVLSVQGGGMETGLNLERLKPVLDTFVEDQDG